MRAGALSDLSVAALVKEGFVCAWEKKGAVEVYRIKEDPGATFKAGGNILTYVCTPRGEVIHAIPGTRDPRSLKSEIEWARQNYRQLAGQKPEQAAASLRAAHEERLPAAAERDTAVLRSHRLLSKKALRPIREVEKEFFEIALNQFYAPDRDIVIREVRRKDFDALPRVIG